MKRLAVLFFLIHVCNYAYADRFGYDGIVDLWVESKNFIVLHHHDWSGLTLKSRHKMISTHQDPFRDDNNYAYLLCINKRTGDTTFRIPCPALTKVVISDDENYITGVSEIMLWNPYHLLVTDTTGNILFKRHISPVEAKLTPKEHDHFKDKFTSKYNYLLSIGRIHFVDSAFYIDYSSMDMPRRLRRAWDYLRKHTSSNHLSNNFNSTVTNYVFWYSRNDPGIEFEYDKGKLAGISLLDPAEKRIQISFNSALSF